MTWGVLQTSLQKKPLPQSQEKETVTVGAQIYPNYPQNAIHALGAAQTLCGLLIFVLGIVHLHITEERMTLRYDVSTAEGVLFIVTGVIVFLSGFTRTRGLIITASVTSILSCIAAIGLAIGWAILAYVKHRCSMPPGFEPNDDLLYPKDGDDDDHHDDSHERHMPQKGMQRPHGMHRQESKVGHPHGPRETVLEITDWVLLAIFCVMLFCSVAVVINAIRAFKKRPAEGEPRETHVFVITPEKGAVLS